MCRGIKNHFALMLYRLFSAALEEKRKGNVKHFIVDKYIMKGDYCLGSLFSILSCWSKFNRLFYCLNDEKSM